MFACSYSIFYSKTKPKNTDWSIICRNYVENVVFEEGCFIEGSRGKAKSLSFFLFAMGNAKTIIFS